MSFAKIALPFNQACKLNNEQKCKLITCQARRITIQEWEIDALLDICKSKGWIDKGLAVLYEYAGYIDDIKAMMEMRNDMFSYVLNEITTLGESIELVDSSVSSLLSRIAAMTAKVIYTLCCWRRLQWSPRPIFFEDFVAIGYKLSFQAILREDAVRLFEVLQSNQHLKGLLDRSEVTVEQLTILLAPGVNFNDISTFLWDSELFANNSDNNSLNSFDNQLQQHDEPQRSSPQSTPQQQTLFSEIREMLCLEDRIESSWRSFYSVLSSASKGKAVSDPYDLFPTLRLPYKDFKPPTEDLAWFIENISHYNTLASSLVAMSKKAESHSPHSKRKYAIPSNQPQFYTNDGTPGAGERQNGTKPELNLIETSPVVFSRKSVPSKAKKSPSSARSKQSQQHQHHQQQQRQRQTYEQNDEEVSLIAEESVTREHRDDGEHNRAYGRSEDNDDEEEEVSAADRFVNHSQSASPVPSTTSYLEIISSRESTGSRTPPPGVGKHTNSRSGSGNSNRIAVSKSTTQLPESVTGSKNKNAGVLGSPSSIVKSPLIDERKRLDSKSPKVVGRKNGSNNSTTSTKKSTSESVSSLPAVGRPASAKPLVQQLLSPRNNLDATNSPAGSAQTYFSNGQSLGTPQQQGGDEQPSRRSTGLRSSQYKAQQQQQLDEYQQQQQAALQQFMLQQQQQAQLSQQPFNSPAPSSSAMNKQFSAFSSGANSYGASPMGSNPGLFPSPYSLSSLNGQLGGQMMPQQPQQQGFGAGMGGLRSPEQSFYNQQMQALMFQQQQERQYNQFNQFNNAMQPMQPTLQGTLPQLQFANNFTHQQQIQIPQQQMFNPDHVTARSANNVEMTPDQTVRKRSVTIAVVNRHDDPNSDDPVARRVTVANGPMSLADFQAQHAQATAGQSSKGPSAANTPMKSARKPSFGTDNGNAVLPSAMKKASTDYSSPTPSRPASGSEAFRTYTDDSNEDNNKDDSYPAPVDYSPAESTVHSRKSFVGALPSQMARQPSNAPSLGSAVNMGESFNSLQSNVRTGSADFLYNAENGRIEAIIAGEEDGIIFQSTPLMHGTGRKSFANNTSHGDNLSNLNNSMNSVGENNSPYQMFQSPAMYAQQNPARTPPQPTNVGRAVSEPFEGQLPEERRVYYPHPNQQQGFYYSPDQYQVPPSRGRVYSADSGLPKHNEYMAQHGMHSYTPQQHRKSAPVRNNNAARKKIKSASPVVQTGFKSLAKSLDLLRPRIDFLHSALQSIEMRGGSTFYIAASKIAVFWRLLSPRRKLSKRIAIRECILSILLNVVDVAVGIGHTKFRRRQELLRAGAAMKIQRVVRHWSATTLVELKAREQIERSRMAWISLTKLARAVIVGIKIHRYLKYLQRKNILRRNSSTKTKTRPLIRIRKTLENYIQLLSLSKKLLLQQAMTNQLGEMNFGTSKRARMYEERKNAVVIIQKYFRRFAALKVMKQRKVFNIMHSKICMFLIVGVARRRIQKRLRIHRAAVKIQTFFRGIKIRKTIFAMVRAGLRLNAIWRKHRAYKSLKSQLRRVDRPHTLVIHGVRNINKKFMSSDSLKFKLSVWWNPLLHIVSQNDFDTIINSKQPQFIYNSSNHQVTDDEPVLDPTSSAFSRSLKNISKLSTSLIGSQSVLESPSAKSSVASQSAYGRAQLKEAFADHPITPTSKGHMKDSFSDIISKSENGKADYSNSSSNSNSAANSPIKLTTAALTAQANAAALAADGKRKESVVSVVPMKPSALLHMDGFDEDDEDEEEEKEDEDFEARSHHSPKSGSDSNHMPKTPPRGNYTYGIKEENNDGGAHGNANPREGRKSVLKNRGTIASGGTTGASFLRTKLGESIQLSAQLSQDNKIAIDTSMAESGGVKDDNSSISSSNSSRMREQKGDHSASHQNLTSPGGTIIPQAPTIPSGSIAEDQSSQQTNSMISVTNKSYMQPTHSFSATVKRPSIFSRAAQGTGMSIMRQTINFAMKLGNVARKPVENVQNPKFVCNFEDETVKIPGCHGNSVFKFEIMEGERKFAVVHFYLSKEGEMMYWGGEYQKEMSIVTQRRAIQFNAHIISNATERTTKMSGDAPILEFRVIAGAALRSRCQWGRIVVRGSGPLKRSLQSKDVMGSFLFDKWHRFYMSLDQFSLDFFENKFCTVPFHSIPVKDLKEVKVDIGTPIRQNKAAVASKSIVEDITNVILTTHSGDEIYMRFQDSGSRVAWTEVLGNAIEYSRKVVNGSGKKNNWLSKLIRTEEEEEESPNNSPVHHPGLGTSPPQLMDNFTATMQRKINEGGDSAKKNRSRMPPIFAVPHASKLNK